MSTFSHTIRSSPVYNLPGYMEKFLPYTVNISERTWDYGMEYVDINDRLMRDIRYKWWCVVEQSLESNTHIDPYFTVMMLDNVWPTRYKIDRPTLPTAEMVRCREIMDELFNMLSERRIRVKCICDGVVDEV